MLKSLWPCMPLHALQKVNVNITVLIAWYVRWHCELLNTIIA